MINESINPYINIYIQKHRLREKFGPLFDRLARSVNPVDVLGCAMRTSSGASLSSSLRSPPHVGVLLANSTSSPSSSPSSATDTPSSSSSTLPLVIDDTCDRISSPSKFLFFKLPIQKMDEHLLAARAPFTLYINCSTVSRIPGIRAIMAVFLIAWNGGKKMGF